MADNDRLNPALLSSPLFRARLYRDIQQQTPLVSFDSWTDHIIEPSEVLMPELVALREYGSSSLKWVVLVAASLDDYRQPMTAGETVTLPSIEWLRDRLKYYERLEAIDVTPAPVIAAAQQVATGGAGVTIPGSDAASQALEAALAALDAPTPLLSERDRISDESLNRQRNAIETKLAAIRAALAAMKGSD